MRSPNVAYFVATGRVAPESLAANPDIRLYPGMPAEVLIRAQIAFGNRLPRPPRSPTVSTGVSGGLICLTLDISCRRKLL